MSVAPAEGLQLQLIAKNLLKAHHVKLCMWKSDTFRLFETETIQINKYYFSSPVGLPCSAVCVTTNPKYKAVANAEAEVDLELTEELSKEVCVTPS
jgi:hypothetical protein